MNFYKTLLEKSPIGYAHCKIILNDLGIPSDFKFIEVNSFFEKLTGLQASAIIGEKALNAMPDLREGAVDWINFYGDIALGAEDAEYEQFFEGLGIWCKVKVSSPKLHHFAIYLTDISNEMKMLEEQITLNISFNDSIIELDEEFRYLKTYSSNENMTFSGGEKIIGKTVSDVHGKAFAAEVAKVCGKARKTGEKAFLEHYIPSSNKWFMASIIYRTDSFNQKKYVIVTSDITQRKAAEQALFAEKERLKVTLQSIGDAVITTDKNGKIVDMNRIAQQLTGWTEKEAQDKDGIEVLRIFSEKTGKQSVDFIKKVLKSGQILGQPNDILLCSKDGKEYHIAKTTSPIKDLQGVIHGAVIVFRDITKEKNRQQEIEYLSYHDSLTKLYNRRFFEEELRRLDTPRNLPLSIIIGDLNQLKITNDVFGHAAGDELLQKAANIITASCRTDDIVARWGGDEFVIILPQTEQSFAEKIINRITTTCSSINIGAVNLSISFGCEAKTKRDEDIATVIKKAEENMYKHKMLESTSAIGRTINTIQKTLYEKNQREEAHSKRVSEICGEIGVAMNLPESKINELKVIGLMHDIGKIAVRDDVLNKTSPLTANEWIEIKRHPEISYRILISSSETIDIANYILAHHEHFDGNGYPKGIAGEEIPLQARILALADAVDAMTSERPYRKPLTCEQVRNELIKGSGTQFDPDITALFLKKVMKDNGTQEICEKELPNQAF